MPYREKIAWLSLIAMAVAFVPYFTITAMRQPSGAKMPDLFQLGLFAAATIVQLIILGLGHLYFRSRFADDEHTPPDERDIAIMRRSITSAYYFLTGGMIVVGCIMPFNSGGWKIVNSAILGIVLAEIVHYSVSVASYRRQA